MKNLDTLQALVERLDSWGDKECILQMEREGVTRWTCAQVAHTARQLARGLIEAGLKPGEFVPILAHNRPEWVVAALAVVSAGAAVSPLDTQLRPDALARVLNDCRARFIFTTTDFLNRLGQLALDTRPRPILFDVPPDDARSWRVLLSTGAAPLPAIGPNEPATLFYTSGTTGVPKGVPLTHRNLTFQLQSVEQAQLVTPGDRILLPLPMYHVYPFTVGTLTPLAFGLPIILPQSLTGPQIVRALAEGRVTIIIGVPRVYRAVYNGIEAQINGRGKLFAAAFNKLLATSINARRRFGWQLGQTLFKPLRARIGPQVRLLASGGSALDPELAWKLEGFGWNVAIGYGLTETSPMLTMNLPGPTAPRLASAGRPLPGIDLRIVPLAKTETEQADGGSPKQGEIQARGVSVFAGYRHLPAETGQVFTDDGWFRTGDLGYFDDDGYLYIDGRASTLIVLEGGKKIQPDPLEDVYEQNEFIREIGILYRNNQLVALIVPELEAVNRLRNGDVNQAIREAVTERLQAVSSYQRISDYAITEAPLPRTNIGKIRRHLLEEYYTQAKQGTLQANTEATGPLAIADMAEKDRALLAHPAAGQVWGWLAERYADKRLTPDTSPQLELGVDSLEWLTLSLQVSELTGAELSDEAIGRITTVRDLLVEVRAAAEREQEPVTSLANPESLLSAGQKEWLAPPGPFRARIASVLFFVYQNLARLLFGVRVYGLENLPRPANFVLTPNHASMLDAPMIAAALPLAVIAQTHWAGAADIMLTNPLFRLVSRLARVLPIDRQGGGSGVKNLALATAALQRGRNLVWFPEGRITTTGAMLPFREGIGIILEQQPVPVVPVYLFGTAAAMPVQASLPKFKPVTITFGPPCDPLELAAQGEGDNPAARIAQALQAKVAELGGRPHNQPSVRRRNFGPAILLGSLLALVSALGWFVFRRGRK